MIKCIAIDDEPRALDIIDNYVNKIDFLDIVGKFRNPLDALDFLTHHQVNLIFLDINMPDVSGTEFVKVLKDKPLIIFTTAYSEFAVESYELDAADYLLKPFEFNRFLKAVLKARELLELKDTDNAKPVFINQSARTIQVKSGTVTHQVKLDDINYIEGLGNYINICLIKEKLVTYTSLKDILNLLPENEFIRVHKSYIVAINKINAYEYHQLNLNGKVIPIGKNFRKSFTEYMRKRI